MAYYFRALLEKSKLIWCNYIYNFWCWKLYFIQQYLDKTTWYDDFADINTDKTELAIEREDGEDSFTVYWRWCFEGTDANAHAGQTNGNDTTLGVAAQTAADELTIKCTVTATQVDVVTP